MSHPEPSSVHALWAGALSTQLNLRCLRQASFIPAGSTEHTEGVRGRQKRTRWPELTGAARASSCHLGSSSLQPMSHPPWKLTLDDKSTTQGVLGR